MAQQQPTAQPGSSQGDKDLSDMQPSSAELEQAMGHLARIASLLDSRASASSSSSSPSFPGLIDVLPHLLGPLATMQRSTSARSAAVINSNGPVDAGGLQSSSASAPPLSTAHISGQDPLQPPLQLPPSAAIIETYRPLVAQVQALLSQLGGCVAAAATPTPAPAPGDASQAQSSSSARTSSLQVAEWAHATHQRRQKRVREDENEGQNKHKGKVTAGLSKEEKREAILRARRQRRQQQEGVSQPEPPQEGGTSELASGGGANDAAAPAGQGMAAKPEDNGSGGQSLDVTMAEGGAIPTSGAAHPPPHQPLGGTTTSMA